MNPDIEKAVEAGKLTPSAAAVLDRIPPGTFVMHKSWGFGQIETVNFLLSQVTIDFKSKKSHPMQMQYAAESLQPLPSDHILALKAGNLSGLKTRVKEEPVGVVRQILNSFGGRATQDQMAQALTPDVLTEAEFKRWFENTKKALKKDGHFTIPSKRSEAFELRDGPVSHADEYLATFRAARRLKDQINALEQILKNIGEFNDAAGQLQPILPPINETARKSQRLHTAEALSLLLSRDELIERSPGLEKGADAPLVSGFLKDEQRQLAALLGEVPAAKLKRVMAEVPDAFGEEWPVQAITLVLRGSTRVVGEAARVLIEKGHTDALRTALDRAIAEHSITSEALSWLAKERSGPFSGLATVRLLSAILSALERDQFSEKRDRKLHDLLLNDQELLPDLVSDAAPEDLRDIMRKLLLSGAFEELNKRSLLGRIIRIHPDLQAMVSGETGEKQESLIVSWASLEKRKLEFEDLVNKKIPENTKEISIAREHGDLRENFEFKAAKEMQRVLMRRKADTERELSLARGTDFANPDTTLVAIGTVVTLKTVSSGASETYSILGAWDGDPDKNIISYQAAIAQAIMGRKVADRANVPTENGEEAVEIVSIEAHRK